MKIVKIAGYLYQIIKTRKKQQKIAKEWSDLKKSTDDARDLLRRVSSKSNETVMWVKSWLKVDGRLKSINSTGQKTYFFKLDGLLFCSILKLESGRSRRLIFYQTGRSAKLFDSETWKWTEKMTKSLMVFWI